MPPLALETAAPSPAAPPGPVLSVVIPALDEEEAIGTTIAACRAAAEEIARGAGLAGVETIVVSDGSTDRTVEIARSFAGVRVIVFERNRGYGAAIKEGFRQASGALLGFLDADGTCDPRCFGALCRCAIEEDADIVVGSRLGPRGGLTSRMPRLRRVGNGLFAVLLGSLCGRRVTDTASGMRVVRRGALEALAPLPDGLHFTPSMSARALLGGLRVAEVPIPYGRRLGRSKLSVARDGMRFLRTIVASVMCYQPQRPFLAGFAACLALSLCLAAYPIEFYLRLRFVEEWMIYRFLACFVLGSVGYQFLAGAALAGRMAMLGPRPRGPEGFWSSLPGRLFEGPGLGAVVAVMGGLSLVLLWPGIVEYATTLEIRLHWSRVVIGAFGLVLLGQTLITGVLLRVLTLWSAERGAAERDRAAGAAGGAARPLRLRAVG